MIASGLIMIVGAWALIYTFRSWVPYDASVLWGRYHVFPLAGLALAGGAALQWMFGERLPRRPLWNVASVAGAAALLLLIHFAPGRAGVQRFWFPEQPLQFDQAAAVFDLAHEFDLPRSWLLENIWLPVEMGEGRFRNAPEFYPQPAASNPRPEEFRAALDRLDFPVGPLAGWERGIELLGASVPRSISQGGILQATLYWRSTTVVADDYTVFVHLRDAEGPNLQSKRLVPRRQYVAHLDLAARSADQRPTRYPDRRRLSPGDLFGGRRTLHARGWPATELGRNLPQ